MTDVKKSDEFTVSSDDKKSDNLLMPGLKPSGATDTSKEHPTGNVTQVQDNRTEEQIKTGKDASSGKNPPVLTHGRVKDTNLVNQDGQPLENNPLVTGNTGFAVTKDGVVDERIPVNTADGTTGGTTDVNRDQHERMEERDQVVIDRVSGNPVVVRGRIREDDRKVFEEMSNQAHDSLKGSTIQEIGLNHPYWGLMEKARQFGKSKGLI